MAGRLGEGLALPFAQAVDPGAGELRVALAVSRGLRERIGLGRSVNRPVAAAVRLKGPGGAAEVDAHPADVEQLHLHPGVGLVHHEARRDAQRLRGDHEGVRPVSADPPLGLGEVPKDVAGVRRRLVGLDEGAEVLGERGERLLQVRLAGEAEPRSEAESFGLGGRLEGEDLAGEGVHGDLGDRLRVEVLPGRVGEEGDPHRAHPRGSDREVVVGGVLLDPQVDLRLGPKGQDARLRRHRGEGHPVARAKVEDDAAPEAVAGPVIRRRSEGAFDRHWPQLVRVGDPEDRHAGVRANHCVERADPLERGDRRGEHRVVAEAPLERGDPVGAKGRRTTPGRVPAGAVLVRQRGHRALVGPQRAASGSPQQLALVEDGLRGRVPAHHHPRLGLLVDLGHELVEHPVFGVRPHVRRQKEEAHPGDDPESR